MAKSSVVYTLPNGWIVELNRPRVLDVRGSGAVLSFNVLIRDLDGNWFMATGYRILGGTICPPAFPVGKGGKWRPVVYTSPLLADGIYAALSESQWNYDFQGISWISADRELATGDLIASDQQLARMGLGA